MLLSITKEVVDYSTEDSFSFGFRCDRCGNIWKSENTQFQLKRVQSFLGDNLKSKFWTKQHDEAWERANNEAIFYFNHCPICSRWVCNDCFFVEESEYTDVCVDCRR